MTIFFDLFNNTGKSRGDRKSNFFRYARYIMLAGLTQLGYADLYPIIYLNKIAASAHTKKLTHYAKQ